uniref:Olfactory receptor n=1 Tax=Rhinopithecus roxellana TaxID=61622 RepID=A0A2K6QTY1_RHIRO
MYLSSRMITSVSPRTNSSFLLTGFSGMEQQYPWFSIPFSSIYAMVLLGNCMVLHVIWTEPSLHQPMFYFLSMLALTDLCMRLSTVYTVLGILLDFCITQSYFIHGLSFIESSVLLAMAFDRYIAICNPLRYSSILTNSRISKIGLTIIGRSFFFIIPPIIHLKFFNYCHFHILSHSFCLHQDLLRLACSDIRFNSYYALMLVIFLAVASLEERHKLFQTCISHVCAVLVFYMPIISLTMVHHFGKYLSPVAHVLIGNIYILFPPLMNPIIYSVKTQQIHTRMLRLFSLKRY